MVREATGLIEAVGMANAVQAADAAVKSANVRLIGYEISDNFGGVVIKLAGDVAAVTAAVDSAKSMLQDRHGIFAAVVISCPAEGIEKLIGSRDTVLGNGKRKSRSPRKSARMAGFLSHRKNEEPSEEIPAQESQEQPGKVKKPARRSGSGKKTAKKKEVKQQPETEEQAETMAQNETMVQTEAMVQTETVVQTGEEECINTPEQKPQEEN